MRQNFSKFLSDLRHSLPGHRTYKEVWAWILGDAVPSKCFQKVLVSHFNEHGLEVCPRDFVRGTAASNNPIFIHLRMLRNTLSRKQLDTLFFSTANTTSVKESKRKDSANVSQA